MTELSEEEIASNKKLDALRARLEQPGTCEGCGKPMPSRYAAMCHNCVIGSSIVGTGPAGVRVTWTNVKQKIAEYLYGATVVLGMGWGGLTLLGILMGAVTHSPSLEWVPSIYLFMLVAGVFVAYIYGLIKLMELIASWADA
jgi:hypothetical protein